jgi:hypothetical protein
MIRAACGRNSNAFRSSAGLPLLDDGGNAYDEAYKVRANQRKTDMGHRARMRLFMIYGSRRSVQSFEGNFLS